ncbi:MAG TPA: alpha/beta fold hydrolase [Bacillota bacterium]|nr:alpha/beta fold hydrolase [Bacillota bacterium]HPT86529.1 alpha/beta fold hydrolase [Bacillota bacterium]
MENDWEERFQRGLKMAEAEYHHPDCEKSGAADGCRSFCFHHHRPTEQAVLLIHGFTACPYEMLELGQFLCSRGHNVFGVRLAGHGTHVSDFAKTTGADWEASAQKGLEIAASLGRKVTVIGESMGGALAVLLASSYPDCVHRLVLCAPCFEIANPMAYLARYAFIRKVVPQTDMGVALEWQRQYWYGKIPTKAVAELVTVAGKARKLAPEIKAPVLVIQAENDQMVRWQGARRFFEKLASSKKTLKLFESGHHNLTIDLNPQKQQVFEWILKFIEE